MRHILASCSISALCLISAPAFAEPQVKSAPPSAAGAQPNCAADAVCRAPALARPPDYPLQLARDADFSAEVTIDQPCSCTRRLNMLIAFTPKGTTSTREHTWKLDVAAGTTTSKLVLSHAQLAKEKIKAGRYTLTFTLFDEHEHPTDPGKLALSGLPFSLGSSHEVLTRAPSVPASIARDAELNVPFVFGNSGDISSDVTGLLVFTRPDANDGIEYYKPNLGVRPGGTTHSLRLSAAQRRELGVGPGPWLVTASAFDGAGERLATFPGNLLMIGKVLAMPAAPVVSSPIEHAQDLTVKVTFSNDGEVPDKVMAVLSFSRPDLAKPIEYKVEGIDVPVGTTTQTITLSALDRYNLGIRPGRWRVSATAFDRANKRLEVKRGNELEIRPEPAELSAK